MRGFSVHTTQKLDFLHLSCDMLLTLKPLAMPVQNLMFLVNLDSGDLTLRQTKRKDLAVRFPEESGLSLMENSNEDDSILVYVQFKIFFS